MDANGDGDAGRSGPREPDDHAWPIHDVRASVNWTVAVFEASVARGRPIRPWNLRRLFERRYAERRSSARDHDTDRAALVTGRALLRRRTVERMMRF